MANYASLLDACFLRLVELKMIDKRGDILPVFTGEHRKHMEELIDNFFKGGLLIVRHSELTINDYPISCAEPGATSRYSYECRVPAK